MITNLKCCHKVLSLNEMLKTAELKEKEENSVIAEIYNKNKSVPEISFKFIIIIVLFYY